MAKPTVNAGPTGADIEAIAKRLHEAAGALLAIHKLAQDGQEDSSGLYLVAIEELARSTYRGIDACAGRLGGGVPRGYFVTEFDPSPAEIGDG